jgi:hypothetical protein
VLPPGRPVAISSGLRPDAAARHHRAADLGPAVADRQPRHTVRRGGGPGGRDLGV